MRKDRKEAAGRQEGLGKASGTGLAPRALTETVRPGGSLGEGMGSRDAVLRGRGQEITRQQRPRMVKSEPSPSPGS